MGKTYAGKIFKNRFGYYFYDGDTDMSEEMHTAVRNKELFTDPMRDEFFERLLKSVKDLANNHEDLAIAQTFIKEKYRRLFLDAFPRAQFILIKSKDAIREKRLAERTDYPMDRAYVKKMVANFELPQIPHIIIDNSVNGEEMISQELANILK